MSKHYGEVLLNGMPINQEFDEKVRLLLAREDVNRKLIKGISQRVERLERGEAAPPPTDLIPARRPEEV